jgi:integrase
MQPYCNLKSMVAMMGTVTKRVTTKGEVRYRALIQVRKQNIDFSESKTFSKKSFAEAWLKKREAEIEANPDILLGKVKAKSIRLSEAIDRYIEDVNEIGTTKLYKLQFIKTYDFAQKRLSELTREDYAQYTITRRRGDPAKGLEPISKATAEQDLQFLRSVLNHAELVLNQPNAINELNLAMRGLRNARQIDRSDSRDRLPTSEELQTLTNHFYSLWLRPNTTMPLHLIMWLAIYTSRRRGELFRLRLEDYDADHGVWMVRDLKNPKGSKGNNKRFKINEKAKHIIDQLLDPAIRKKMMRLGGDESLLLPLDASSTTRVFTNACKIHGIEDLCWHDLRHEAATRFAEQGLTIPQIQQFTLHDSWSSLQRYVNLDLIRKDLLTYKQAIEVAKTTGIAEAIKKSL